MFLASISGEDILEVSVRAGCPSSDKEDEDGTSSRDAASTLHILACTALSGWIDLLDHFTTSSEDEVVLDVGDGDEDGADSSS
jgi:hypothetical protein